MCLSEGYEGVSPNKNEILQTIANKCVTQAYIFVSVPVWLFPFIQKLEYLHSLRIVQCIVQFVSRLGTLATRSFSITLHRRRSALIIIFQVSVAIYSLHSARDNESSNRKEKG